MAPLVAAFGCVMVGLFLGCAARDGFIKDQSTTNMVFPPRIIPKRPGGDIPTGHFRPLGYQKETEGSITEADRMPLPHDFYSLYVLKRKPVVFRRAMIDVPAMKTWADDKYLKKTYGDLNVKVLTKRERKKAVTKTMKLRKFLSEYHYEDWCLLNLIPQEMMHEVAMAPCMKCGLHKYLEGSQMWLSSGGTTSALHSHADHNLHCVLAGRKDFIVIEPQHRSKVAFQATLPFTEAGQSPVDMERVDLFSYPTVAHAPWRWSTLWPGDCMFVPAGFLEQIRSYGRSFSTTTHWFPTPKVKLNKCKKDVFKFTPLSDAKFMWVYVDGREQLMNTKLDARNLKRHLLLIMREEPTLTFDLFKLFYEDVMADLEGYEPVEDVWDTLASSDSASLSRAEVRDLDTRVLDSVANAVNFPHRVTPPEHTEL